MSQENVEVVRRQFEAFAQGGVDAAAAFWHPDIEWRAVEGAVDDIGVFKGRDAMARYYGDWADMVEDLRGEVTEVVYESGEILVVVVRTSGHARGSNAPIHGRHSVVYTIRDGQIVRGREYETPEQALEALELSKQRSVRRSSR
jgi:ketosteroid isomerase-like protein